MFRNKFMFMSPDDGGATGGEDTPSVAVEPTKEPASKENMIPKSRFDEVYQEMKTLKERVKLFEDSKVEEERKALETKEEFKKLYEQSKAEIEKYKPLEQKVQEYEATLEEMVKAKLLQVPEEYKELIPENLSKKEKLEWLSKAEEKGLFGKKTIGGPTNPPAQTVDLTKLSAQDKMRMAYETSIKKK
jgi:hypothetical protein